MYSLFRKQQLQAEDYPVKSGTAQENQVDNTIDFRIRDADVDDAPPAEDPEFGVVKERDEQHKTDTSQNIQMSSRSNMNSSRMDKKSVNRAADSLRALISTRGNVGRFDSHEDQKQLTETLQVLRQEKRPRSAIGTPLSYTRRSKSVGRARSASVSTPSIASGSGTSFFRYNKAEEPFSRSGQHPATSLVHSQAGPHKPSYRTNHLPFKSGEMTQAPKTSRPMSGTSIAKKSNSSGTINKTSMHIQSKRNSSSVQYLANVLPVTDLRENMEKEESSIYMTRPTSSPTTTTATARHRRNVPNNNNINLVNESVFLQSIMDDYMENQSQANQYNHYFKRYFRKNDKFPWFDPEVKKLDKQIEDDILQDKRNVADCKKNIDFLTARLHRLEQRKTFRSQQQRNLIKRTISKEPFLLKQLESLSNGANSLTRENSSTTATVESILKSPNSADIEALRHMMGSPSKQEVLLRYHTANHHNEDRAVRSVMRNAISPLNNSLDNCISNSYVTGKRSPAPNAIKSTVRVVNMPSVEIEEEPEVNSRKKPRSKYGRSFLEKQDYREIPESEINRKHGTTEIDTHEMDTFENKRHKPM